MKLVTQREMTSFSSWIGMDEKVKVSWSVRLARPASQAVLQYITFNGVENKYFKEGLSFYSICTGIGCCLLCRGSRSEYKSVTFENRSLILYSSYDIADFNVWGREKQIRGQL